MILLEKVSKHYSIGRDVIRAADDVSLEVGDSEFVVITGPSGSGKTTLLNLIGGMTRPQSGRVIVAGRDIFSMPDAELSRFRARTMGFAFQFQSMLPTLTAIDNLRIPSLFTGGRDDEEKAALSLLENVGLSDRAQAFSHELSAGQQRRVCIARALINNPSILLCDEPTGDLDPETETVIMDMIKGANRSGATVIMTTHNRALRSYATRSLRIKAGRISDEEV